MDGASSTASTDDLEIVKVVNRSSKQRSKSKERLAPWSSAPPEEDKQPVEGMRSRKPEPSKVNRKDGTSGVKVEWSDDDFDDPRELPVKPKSLKRKRREPKAKKGVKLSKKRRRVEDFFGNDNDSQESVSQEGSDDEDDSTEIPAYIQTRRSKFDERARTLKQGGLKLPPSYKDIAFSDDENLDGLEERPEFFKLQPLADYQDKELHVSLGVIPAPLAQWLRDYQFQGTAFLHRHFVYQEGGILGDDMGKLISSLG